MTEPHSANRIESAVGLIQIVAGLFAATSVGVTAVRELTSVTFATAATTLLEVGYFSACLIAGGGLMAHGKIARIVSMWLQVTQIPIVFWNSVGYSIVAGLSVAVSWLPEETIGLALFWGADVNLVSGNPGEFRLGVNVLAFVAAALLAKVHGSNARCAPASA